ncbi:MAG: DegT/DnrJ/EryC1/StrS family aminotransferase [Flavobacteriaceae bacterium]|nr:DegT/DnrJ/EryC1/StrS family aminotransferase [Flavobacteriaceae bacterium]
MDVIQWNNIALQNAEYKELFGRLTTDFITESYYILGEALERFENAFAAYCGVDYCIGVGNGFDALRIILEGYKQLGKLQLGDGVLVSANAYIATVLAIKHAGLTPVFTEAEGKTYGFDLKNIKYDVSHTIKAILPVHLYGQITQWNRLKSLAEEKQWLIIEDAAQAHGAEWNGKKSGSLGDAAAFSFYPTKNLGALGDGGAITTDDTALAICLKSLRNYGFNPKNHCHQLGFNTRLDSMQAIFLYYKLKNLDRDNQVRRQLAQRYLNEIINPLVQLPVVEDWNSHVFHLMVVRVQQRERFRKFLLDRGIETAVHYPIPPHQQIALQEFNTLSFPISEAIHQQVVSLPMHPKLTEDEVRRVITAVNAFR